MPTIHQLVIKNYRGIKEFSQVFNSNFVCLIARGDSGKSTILDAINATLSSSWNLQFFDNDFYNCDTTAPIEIQVTLVDIPEQLLREDKYGLYQRGDKKDTGEILDDIEDDLLAALTIRLEVNSDIITANADSSSLTVLRNNAVPGKISLSSFQRIDIPLGFRPQNASIADIDGDGKTDILVARADGKSSVLIRNTSTPGRVAGYPVTLTNIAMVGNIKNEMTIYDINGDGKPDLLSISAHRDSVYLYTNKFTGGQGRSDYFNERESFAIASLPDCIGDLDGDGRPDMIISTRFGIDIYHSKTAPVQIKSSSLTAENDSLSVPQVISPNGDGINDVLLIAGIQKFPMNHLTIISANSVKVFEKKGYGSDSKLFDGRSSINGHLQNPGTFFFRLEYTAGRQEKIKTGYFVLKY